MLVWTKMFSNINLKNSNNNNMQNKLVRGIYPPQK